MASAFTIEPPNKPVEISLGGAERKSGLGEIISPGV
jgi:hypothetical protein